MSSIVRKYLMYKDIPVLKMEYTKTLFTLTILNKNNVPLQFINTTNKQKEWQKFLQKRVPIFTDKNCSCVNAYVNEKNVNIIDKIKATNTQKDFVENFVNLKKADLFFYTSVIDSYWIKDENEVIEWKNINPRTHELKDICKDKELALKLEYQNEIASNGLGILNGATPKIWKHNNSENVTLYKQGGVIETKAEVLTSKILKHTNIPYLKYEQVSERCCKCENIANEEYSLVSADDILTYFINKNINFETFCSTLNPNLYYGMQVIDFLIDNPDRTIYNQGFIRDNETGNIIDLQPLFDHNNAFSGKLDKLREEKPEQYKIILHHIKKALDKTCLKFDNTLNAGVFKDTEKYLSFMKRAEEIGLYSKNKDKGLFDNLKKNKLLYQINEKYKLTYKDLPKLEMPCIEYDISTETFVTSKAKKISEKQDEINKTISLITNKGHTVGVNFVKNTTIYNIDHKKYQYTHKLESMDNFLKYIEQKYLIEEYEKNQTKQMESSIDISNEEIEQERDFYEF